MPISLTIRHVPKNVRDALALRAAERGQSLQEYLLRTLAEIAQRPTLSEWLDRVRKRKATTQSTVSLADIVADDEDAR